jgi:hypothetical protein
MSAILAARQGGPRPPAAAFSGAWEEPTQPAGPWLFNLKVEGNTLTGQVWEDDGRTGPSTIFDGRIEGDQVMFKYRSLSRLPRAQQMLPALTGPPARGQDQLSATMTTTLVGTLAGNQIHFRSSVDDPANIGAVQARGFRGARAATGPGGTGLFGSQIAGQFTVIRARPALTGRVVVEGNLPRPVFQFSLVNTAGAEFASWKLNEIWQASPPRNPQAAGLAARTGSAFDIVPRFATSALPGNPAEFLIRLPSGDYSPRLGGLPAGYVVKSIQAGAWNSSSGALKISDSAASPELIITLGTTNGPPWATVAGRVVNVSQRMAGRGGNVGGNVPSPPRAVVLVSSAFSEHWIAPISPDGSFRFDRVLPGRYELRGFPDSPVTPALDLIVPESAVVPNLEIRLPDVPPVPCPAC